MPEGARLGDSISCGDIMCEGSGNVFWENMPAVRVLLDLTCGHCYAPTTIASGSPTVFVNNQPAARLGDPITPHTCAPIPATHGGNIAESATTVFIDS